MSRRTVAVLVVALAASLAARGAGQAPDPVLEEGVRQAQEGEFEQAVITLDGVVKRLRGGGGSPKDLSRACVYLGVAYLGLGQEQAARTSFLEALRRDPLLELSRREYPPRIVDVFQDVRRSAAATLPAAAAPPPVTDRSAPKTPAAPAPAAKKGGSKTPLVLVGLGGAAAAGVAVAASGGGGGGGGTSSPAPVATPVAPSSITLTELSPPSGSSITIPVDPPYYGSLIPRQSGLLRVGLSITSEKEQSQASLGVQLRSGAGICGYNLPDLPSWAFSPGQTVTYTVTGFQLICPRPFPITSIRAFLRGPGVIELDPPASLIIVEATFPASYNVRN